MRYKSFIELVEKCEVKSFIDNDPIQFCYRYKDKKDIEIAGIIASWLSYGSKDIYMPKIDYILNVIMGNKPYDYILGVSWEKYKDDYSCLYRMNTWHNFAMLCEKLRLVYLNNEDLENAVLSHFIDRTTHFKYYYQSLCDLLSGETMIQTEKSLCTSRRMNMFMRWMVRKNSPVDLGIWKGFRQENLLVSCNTDCLNRAKELGIIDLTVESISCAVRVTKYAKKLFPNDPARMDFALCGFGENKTKLAMKPLWNKGFVTRTMNGYQGQLNIENVVFDIQITFWSDKKPFYIWVQRQKEKIFNEEALTFSDYTPKPFFECYAYKRRKNGIVDYKGEFMFVGFKYELIAWFEDKTEHQMNLDVTRSESQPILKRLNEINKEKQKK